MFNFPFMRFPYSNYYGYYKNYIPIKNDITSDKEQNIKDKNEIIDEEYNKKDTEKRSFKYNSFRPISFINPFIDDFHEDEPVLEILGLQLYLDDLIIIGILFLLYKEDVQDEMLFLALILLLIA